MYKNKCLSALSWSRLNIFFECRRCFYKVMVLKKKRPGLDSDFFSLSNVVDNLWKKEFDAYRINQEPHPIMSANNIEAIPFNHEILLIWRDFEKGGIRFLHKESGIELWGVLDDLWISFDGELIVVDYKATAKDQTNTKHQNNLRHKRQMAFYAYLIKNKGLPVCPTGYFVYSAALKDRPNFNQKLEFESTIQPYQFDDSWLDHILPEVRECLDQGSMPSANPHCMFCKYGL